MLKTELDTFSVGKQSALMHLFHGKVESRVQAWTSLYIRMNRIFKKYKTFLEAHQYEYGGADKDQGSYKGEKGLSSSAIRGPLFRRKGHTEMFCMNLLVVVVRTS